MERSIKAVVYSRVSTDAQERDGTSLDSQERACLEYAQQDGWRMVECVRDAASGSTLDRPGIEQIRQLLRQGAVDVVVAYAVDRLSRNQNHIGVLFDEAEQAGARLEFVTEKFEDTAIGRFILAARAFIGEVEREKIAERTMRGKAERARSGRIPQGTGKGCYGYVYNPQTGRREVDTYQAEVVRRIFQRYTETRSFSAVSNEVNGAGKPAFCGDKWYPLTIRRILTNEVYTGRTVYRRTKRIVARNGSAGGRHSRVVERPSEEWIEVPGATPGIVDSELWRRVQEIINDPERLLRRPKSRFYLLRGRARCGVCGSAMVGQTLKVKGQPYRYYRCRHAYDKNTGHSCSAKYVRGQELEEALWRQIKAVLADPRVVLQELQRQVHSMVDAEKVTKVREDLQVLEERERRLVKLYTLGSIDDAAIEGEAKEISERKRVLEETLHKVERPSLPPIPKVDADLLTEVCSGVARWVDQAGEQERLVALEALQVGVEATRDQVTITGVLPLEAPNFIMGEQSCRCLFSGE